MAKIRLTKNELEKQKDSLRMYERYLPTLQLKKQQLQIEIRAAEARRRNLEAARAALVAEYRAWVAVFGESWAPFGEDGRPHLVVASVKTAPGNIAGVEIPVYEGAEFRLRTYDLFAVPLWVDTALDRLRKAVELDLEARVLDRQIQLLNEELRITTQRVNLFEKVKIPEARDAIRRIRIYLGDQQTAQVVRGKIAKRKVEAASSASAEGGPA